MSAGDCGNGGSSGGCECGCCCIHNGAKMEDIQPHPVMEQLPGVQYCINSPPPWLEVVVLAFQHYLMTLGTTVLIPSVFVNQMGGSNVEKAKVIQTLLFVSGLNTLMQSLFGTRLPSVIGGSYAFVIPMTSILHAKRYHLSSPEPNGDYRTYHKFERTMRGMQGALIVASCFQMLIGFLGVQRNVVRFLTPLSVVPLMTFTELGLYHLGFQMYLPHYAKANTKRRVCDRFALLFSVAFVWGYAQILTSSGAYHNASVATQASCRTDCAGLITGAPWLYIPYPFQWGRPTFQAGEAFAMMAASLESTGTFLATARYGSATPVPASVISRGVGWLRFGTLLSGIFGTLTGCTASVENVGLLAMTRVGSRRVIQVSAGFMIFFSLSGKFGAFFASIPLPITAALYCFFFGYVGFSFFLGLSVPQYFREYQLSSGASPVHTHLRWFNDMVTVIFTSHATVAVLVAVILDCTLAREDDEGGKDSGSHWWEKFMFYTRDVRNDEFYKLPCKLNNLFPPV
ncbi:putative nucleobase-ascorbate transporter 10 [Rhododendron vialii]|uniref:putative nucleobase-ascorbate transporter 10 n=1 Tax=Rhododendron vialii TaxID=182163 RepID=UPI00265FE430|nr:putative nucleobase-ascorbate transporter 10 [Rhododendron vialii]